MVHLIISKFLSTLDIQGIPSVRIETLKPLAVHLKTLHDQGRPIRLTFICTHNSRRSILAQVWAKAIASHLGVKDVKTYSGGTESTAVYPTILSTLEHQGFKVSTLEEGANPRYSIHYSESEPAIQGFSKTWDDPFNPSSETVAVMTCSEADEGCPYLPGVSHRFPITYEDPKVSDGSPNESQAYAERSTQIATEMLYLFSSIKN